MQADWSDRSHGRSTCPGTPTSVPGSSAQMFTVRTQRNAAFQGIYNLQETYDGTWREREGYDDDQFFEAETSAFSTRPANVQFSKKAPDTTDFAPIAASSTASGSPADEPAQLPAGQRRPPGDDQLRGVTAIVEHHDSSSKNFYLTQAPETGRWSLLPWDLDHTLGNGCCNVDSNFVTPAETGDNTSALMRAILAEPSGATCTSAGCAPWSTTCWPRGGWRRSTTPPRPGPVRLDARLRGVALPRQPGQLHDVPQAAVRRHQGAPQRVRQRRPRAGQPAGVAQHGHRRGPALAGRRRHGRVSNTQRVEQAT